MATATAAERRILTALEFDRVAQSYPPALSALKRKDLAALVGWLRRQTAKWRGLERRSGVASGAAGGKAAKLKSFSAALQRAAARLDRIVAEEKKAAMKASMAKALARKKAAPAAARPATGRRAGTGPQPIENRKTRPIVKGSKIGSISQATRNAQARRDNKGKK